MICKNCGREISSQNSRCPHCNTVITAQEVEQYRKEKAQNSEKNEGITKRNIIIILAGLGGLILLGVVAALIWSGSIGDAIRYNYYEKNYRYDEAKALLETSKRYDNDKKYYEFIDTASELFDETEYDSYTGKCDTVIKAYDEIDLTVLTDVRKNKADAVKAAVDKLLGYNFDDIKNKMRIAYDLHEEINKYKLNYGFNVEDEKAKLAKWQEDYKSVNKIYADLKGADLKEYSSVLHIITQTIREIDRLTPDENGMAFFEGFAISYQNSPDLGKIDSEVKDLKNAVVYNCSKTVSIALYGNGNRATLQKPVNYEGKDSQKTYDLFKNVIDFNSYIKTSRSADSDFEHFYRYVDGEDPVASIETYISDMEKRGFVLTEHGNTTARGLYVLQGETERVRISYSTVDKTVTVRVENTNVPK